MAQQQPIFEQPTGRAAALFENKENALSAKEELQKLIQRDQEIYEAHGGDDAGEVDDSARWFADTDEHVELYKRRIKSGASAISAPAENDEALEKIESIFKKHGADLITQFGEIVTKTKKP